MNGGNELGVQDRVFLDEFRDELRAGSLVGGRGNARVASGEKFLLLQLDAFPRRVAQHDIETAGRKHFGKFQRPMKERLTKCKHPGAAMKPRVNGPATEVVGERATRNRSSRR